MDGFIHAALEAEGILNRAKHVSKSVSQIDNYTSDDKMTWKMRLTDSLDESRIKFQRNPGGSNAPKANEKFDLFKKLHELYEELSTDESLQINYQGLKTTSYLLEKLLSKYRLNSLIINLYPGNKGYSLSLKVNGSTQHNYPTETDVTLNQDETMIETPRWPYEEEDLLSYIDNEELPVMLLDLLEAEHSCLFYSGCIIAQIRDYRQAYPSSLCDTHHVLLRPTNQSILTDAMAIGGRHGWASEERGSLEAVEAALVHASAPPLCLDPRPAVGLLAARLHAAPRLFNTPRIRRQARRFSQVAVNRKRKLDQFTHHHGIELLDAIQKQRTRNVLNPNSKVQQPKFPGKPPEVFKAIEAPKMECPSLATPSDEFSPLRSARAYERSRPMFDCYPHLVEEYILETEKTSPHAGAGCFHIKLSILQRPSDQEFLGELYVDRDHIEGERNGAACRFALGSRLQANKYIQQFTEIFTEEGRKSVRIKHIVPGHAPRVSYTGGMRELNQQLLLQQRAAAAAAAAAAASGATVQTHATTVPVVTSAIAQTPNTHTNIRQLPILQAQLQQVGGVGGVSVVGVAAGVAADAALKQQPSPTTPRLSPQVHDVHSTQSSSNQLLTQQLSNPPQPINPPPPQINPQKMPSAIIHIQHPLMSSAGTSQVQNIQYTTTATQQKPTINKQRTTNPAIDALVTSLMNSAQQFQQAASQNAAKSAVSTAGGSAGGGGGTVGSNSTILNLLNSAPAAMTHGHGHAHAHALGHAHGGAGGEHEHKLVARAVSIAGARLVTAAPAVSHTVPAYTQQVMSGYTCESKPTSVSGGDSALLERLMGPDQAGSAPAAASASPAQPAPAAQAQPVCHLQGLSLASLQGLQGLQGLQNVQVQIPGLAAPISLSLNVSGAPGGLLVSVPPTTSVVLANQPSVLSLPIAQLMPGGVKGAVRGGTVQVVRGRAPPRPAPAAHAPHALHTAAGAASATATVTAAPGVAGVNTKRIIRVQHAGDTKHFTGTAQFITQAQAQALSAQHVRRKSNPDSS